MEVKTALTVGEVARLAGVTIRTLHHYDEVGLVTPTEHTDAGYRLYGRREIERLQEVLFFRELDFGLEEIGRLLSESGYRRDLTLAAQRGSLVKKAERLLAMVDLIDATLESDKRGFNMTTEEMLEVFGDFDPREHEDEARRRWGGTAEYEGSNRRVARYTKEDWQQLGAEADAINQGLLGLMADGASSVGSEAMDLAEEHRNHISKWFYACTPEIHAGLGEMYVADQRFRDNINKSGAGLAQYLSEAIAANYERIGADL
jgi:DNA-binding transcriptional MerR regulator